MAITISNAETPNEQTTLIPKSCPIPVRKSTHLDSKDIKDKQVSIIFNLIQNDSSPVQLAKLSLAELNGEAKISVSCHIHTNGAVHLALTDKASGKLDQVDIGKKSEE